MLLPSQRRWSSCMSHPPAPKGRGSHLEPPNRFAALHVERGAGPPDAEDFEAPRNPQTQFILERSRSIVTENDSPDIPFRYSLNPYRGCEHGCSYCLAGDTPILMADGTTCPLANLRVGDEIYGTVPRGDYRRFTRTTVLAHWRTLQPGYRIRLADGTELVASPDHRFLTERGWKHVAPSAGGQRPHLTVNNSLLGTGGFAVGPAKSVVRKRAISGLALKSDAETRVVSVGPLGIELPMYDITTGTGDFLANGVVSHNCYARPTHEYLGFNAGLDFETKIVVKENAPELFRAFLARDAWRPEPIVLAGVTDVYQPAERRFRLTRGCLEVAAEARQPMSLITKNALVLRDLDLLRDLAAEGLVHITLSVTTLDAALARSMEPRTSAPAARLRAVRALADAGVPVRVLVAPLIPGLNDSEVPAVLEAARRAGARAAGYVLLRLPLTVAPVFREWLERERPERLGRVEGRIRDARGGKLNDAAFGKRMCGSGVMARQIGDLFRLFARRHGLDGGLPPHDCTRFRPPLPRSGQLRLF
jgi:DNA repair photolyase